MLRAIRSILVLSTLAVFSMPILTYAQQPQSQKTQNTTNFAAPDREFILKAAEGGHTEVMLAEIALNKATNADVKQFAQRLADDHSKGNEELKTLAASKGVTLPAENAVKSQKLKTGMEKHSGATFDREYIKDMIKAHQKNIAMFEREARNGRDNEVKAWATQKLPTLREHLQIAQDVAGKIGVTGINNGKKGTKDTSQKPQ